MKEQRSYFKRALVLLMAVLMVFTYMPSMAFAGSDPAPSAATTACPVTVTANDGSTLTATASTTETAVQGDGTYIKGSATIYEVKLTAATTSVTISGYVNSETSNKFLAYNYSNTTGGYIESPVTYGKNGQEGVEDVSVKVDANNDGIGDYIFVQTPYGSGWSCSYVCAIKFVYEMPVTVKAGETELTCTKAYSNGCNYGSGATDLYVVNLPANTDSVTVAKTVDTSAKDIKVYNYTDDQYASKFEDATADVEKVVTARTRLAYGKNYDVVNTASKGNYLWVEYSDAESNGDNAGKSICAIKLVLSTETLDDSSVQKAKGTLTDEKVGELQFYSVDGMESMLGNNWYKGNPLTVEVGQTGVDLIGSYKYLNAMIHVPEGWTADNMSKLTLTWYYSDTYSADGTSYQKVTINGANSGKDKDGNNFIRKNQSGFEYSNQYVSENYGTYYWFSLIPDTVKTGNYYYYVDISYTDESGAVQTLSSKDCQAWVTVKEKSTPVTYDGNITVKFQLNGYDGMASIAKESYTVKKGSTVGDVFEKVLTAKGYKYEYKGSNYIASITDKYNYKLGEFDRGSKSGWMYLINTGSGNFAPTVGLNSYVLTEDNTEITWYYTGDYTLDRYARASMTTQTEEQKKAEEEAKAAEEEAKIAAENAEKAVAGAADTSSMDRSVKTKKGNVKVTFKPSTKTQSYIDEMKELGYTVKYRFYRSTKKSSGYKAMLTKTTKTYINTAGKSGTRYYYKTQIRVYDKDGKLVAKTALKDCKYATRIFG